jgi:hypothetical protein
MAGVSGAERLSGADRIEWRRAFPSRALRAVGACAAAGGLAVAAVWVLFGNEPATLNSGEANPLASVPQWTIVAATAVMGASFVPVFRRPSVIATHYALSLRPGMLRTLLLPWATIAEVTGVRAGSEEFLLVRLQPGLDALGDHPGYWDKAVLRAAGRGYPRAGDFDLAVRMREFAGAGPAKVSALAAYAPESVDITSRL